MKRFLFILMWLLPVVYRHALAHTPVYRYYRPDEYCTFRVWGKNMKGEAPFQLSMDLEKQQMDNCRSWAEITSPSIPLAAIREVVYHWSFEQLKQLDQDVVSGKKRTERNAFAQWLIRHKDTEVTAFLMLAKRCETVRQSQNTAWYYPVEGDAVEWELEEIIRQAGAYRGKRLYDRYTLQMLRAYIANRRYTECLNLWLERKNAFREGVIQEMAKGYVAGAYCHIGEIGMAEDMFFEIEDISSYLYCLNKRKAKLSSWDIFYYRCNKNPNGDKVFPCLQYLVHKEETRSKEDSRIAFGALISFLSTEFKERQPDNRAAWYYTLSYAYDRIDIPEKAWKYIRLAEQYNPDPDLREAIRVFRIYLNVKHAQKYDIEFENELYRELVWLDNKIVSCLDSVTRNTIIESGISNHSCGMSQYYWNDMMRKIVISQVVPLCQSSGYYTRALQWLNYADNRIFTLVDKVQTWEGEIVSWQAYRSRKNIYNSYDYCNDFFTNLDTLDVKYAERLLHRMENPLCSLDTFLNERSYTDRQYLCEIIGTKLIASMRYGEAVVYLRSVSDGFIESRNIYSPLERDPFGRTLKREVQGKRYKLNFAEKMYTLEQRIRQADNPNDKAEYMLTYALGVQNSILQCWVLTSYAYGIPHQFHNPSYDKNKRTQKELCLKVNQIKEHAFQLFTDKERAAKACYDWNLFKTAATKYPDTKAAAYIRRHCDQLVDYKDLNRGYLY